MSSRPVACFQHSQFTVAFPCWPSTVTTKDVVSAFLASLKPNMVLIEGVVDLPTWSPPADVASYLVDPIPCARGKPNVLLHELGYFAHEPELQRIVDNVFMPTSPCHAILVNTSGSGKTRLLLEGLCQSWGL